MPRRSYGTGSLTVRRGKWFGQWWVGQKQVGRVIGLVRQPSTSEGLTRSQAEKELRRLIESEAAPVPIHARITIEEAGKRHVSHAPKSILNYLILLQSILTFAQKRGWLRGENPCRFVDKPRAEDTDPDIRFLGQEELEAVLAVEPEHDFDPMLRVMYLTAAMSGRKQQRPSAPVSLSSALGGRSARQRFAGSDSTI